MRSPLRRVRAAHLVALGATFAALSMCATARAEGPTPDGEGAARPEPPRDVVYGFGGGGGLGILAGARGPWVHAHASIDIALSASRYFRLEPGIFFGSGSKESGVHVDDDPARSTELQTRRAAGALG